MNVKTNVGKPFLKLLQRHFPKSHTLHKIFHRNMVKISYYCMRNIDLLYRHTTSKFWIPAKNILDAITEFEMNVFWKINVLHSILCMKQKSLMKPKMNVKIISVLLKHHSKKDWQTTLDTSNKKSLRIAVNFQSTSGL